MNKTFQKVFAKAKLEKRSCFVAFVTGMDPDYESSKQILIELSKYCDCIEIGVSFNTSTSDSSIIMSANDRAIKSGAKTKKIFQLIKEVKSEIKANYFSFNQSKFLKKVKDTVKKHGFCVIVASEGIKNAKGKFLAESDSKDAFGHSQLGGVAPRLADLVNNKLKLKNHWAVADYLQRSASHLSSGTDRAHAYEVGKKAVQYALQGLNGVMPVIKRKSSMPYKWEVVSAPLTKIANVEKKLPAGFISKDGMGMTKKARSYFQPLIEGKVADIKNIKYQAGKMEMVTKKLKAWR